VSVGFSQLSLDLASLESFEEPSWVRRPHLFVGVIHWSGWKDVMVSSPDKLPGDFRFVHSVTTKHCCSLDRKTLGVKVT
jgi:hypothetical protein